MSLFGRQYTLGELMSIDGNRQQKAMYCNVELEKTFHELKPVGIVERFRALFSKSVVNTYYVIFKFNVTSDNGSVRTVIIRTDPDFDLNDWESNRAQVYCSCPDFKYRSAYQLNKSKSLFVNDRVLVELGQAVTDKPKRSTTLLCKHAFAAVQWLVNNYQSVMKTI